LCSRNGEKPRKPDRRICTTIFRPVVAACMPPARPNALQPTRLPLQFRREVGHDFFEARIAAQRVPTRVELKEAVGERVWDTLYGSDLFDGRIFLAGPRVDLRQINGQGGPST